jgi:hypothetical protein
MKKRVLDGKLKRNCENYFRICRFEVEPIIDGLEKNKTVSGECCDFL